MAYRLRMMQIWVTASPEGELLLARFVSPSFVVVWNTQRLRCIRIAQWSRSAQWFNPYNASTFDWYLPCSAFYVDDSLNGFIADYFGIVMGTSHEEPMARSIPVEWNLFGVGEWDYSVNADFIYQFWLNRTEEVKNFETLFTVGMRGDGDRK